MSINSLGFRETSNKISLEEVDPYTVRVTRNLCKTEVLSIARQALIETKFGTQSFDCRDAYATYIAHNITALGVPLLYDSFTGFNLLKERCRKRPPVYRVNTTATDDVIKDEAYDHNTTACKDLPVADVLLTARIDAAVIYIATSTDGIASLPPEKIAQLERAAANTVIKYQYDTYELTTRHVRKAPENPFVVSSAARGSSLADNLPNQQDASPPAEVSAPGASQEKSFLTALSPPATDPLPPVQGTNKTDTNQNIPVKADREAGGGISPPAAIPPPAITAEPLKDKWVGGIKIASPPEKVAVAESPVPAKSDHAGAGVITPPTALLPEETGPEPPRKKAVGDIKAAPAPKKTAATETPLTAKSDQDSTTKKSSPKTVREGASSPKANKPSRDEVKSTAPAAVIQKTHLPAMARTAAKAEPSKIEIPFKKILIFSPELDRLCCPLTEKLFWTTGY